MVRSCFASKVGLLASGTQYALIKEHDLKDVGILDMVKADSLIEAFCAF